ncbi:MAG: hypothetical protein ACFBSE_15040 [Prochloraceae cyanobacterium]
MLTQFRVRYPKGSLISDLVRIDRGQYIVKASVGVDGVTLATAMAAAQTVEQAEDTARQRALAVLLLDSPTTKETNLKQNSQQQSQSNSNSPRADLAPKKVKIAEVKIPVAADNGGGDRAEVETASSQVKIAKSENSLANRPESNSKTKQLDLDRTVVEIETDRENINLIPEAEIEIESSHPEEIEVEIEIPIPEEEEYLDLDLDLDPTLSLQEEPENNLDEQIPKIELSEILARTDLHMNRLGWTKQDGRDHLNSIYGKRSRHSLNNAQLLEFLQFLEAQPDPV